MKYILISFFFLAVTSCNSSNKSSTTNKSDSFLAVDDHYKVAKNAVVFLDVLSNDSYPSNSDVTISFLDNEHLKLVDGGIEYSAPASDNFSLSVTYSISDSSGNTSNATIFIESDNDTLLASINSNPDFAVTFIKNSIDIDVVANDISSVGDTLTITEVNHNPLIGTTAIVDGKIRFNPSETTSGLVTLTYGVKDQSGNSTGGVSVYILVESKVDGLYTKLKLSNLMHFDLPKTGTVLRHHYPEDSSVATGAAGDFNADGFDDFVACYPEQSLAVNDVNYGHL